MKRTGGIRNKTIKKSRSVYVAMYVQANKNREKVKEEKRKHKNEKRREKEKKTRNQKLAVKR